ncbi:MAG: phosphoheptose isomerase [Janthinobacterium lividum]
MSIESIQRQFNESVAAKLEAVDTLAPAVCAAIDTMFSALIDNRKVLACGNGASAMLAQHFAAQLVNRYERDRPALAGLALTSDGAVLTAISNDYDFTQIFAKQVQAFGHAGDILLAISTSGDAANVVEAIHAAHEREMIVVALTGKGGGRMAEALSDTDVHITVAHERATRIHEVHLLTIHCLCDGIDTMLLGEN